MLELTPAAAARLAQLLSRSNVPGEFTVCFVLDGQEVTAEFDRVHDGDVIFEHQGRIILALDTISPLSSPSPGKEYLC